MDRKEVFREVEQIFGLVPDWIRSLPDEVVGELWNIMKKVQLSTDTGIPPKYKELIGLAVASTLRCRYCTYFHTEAAKLDGATEKEIKEALMMAGIVSLFSTYINGSQYHLEKFERETDEMVEHVRQKTPVGVKR